MPDDPERLPEGVELPDGRVLTYSPSRDCACSDCTAAFEALERSELVVREDKPDELPW